MKKALFILMAVIATSCTNPMEETSVSPSFHYTHDEYCVMFGFIEYLHESELFGLPEPEKPTYDEMMMTAAPIVMSDVFLDTLGEGDCTEVYFLMYAYFSAMHPQASITAHLREIINNEMY